jgi:exopolyphosphatase/guanosine-5'-triphosphate,3'-diphosphate pyrophosphatase
MRLGVIDCGTNTFHLLISEISRNEEFKTLYRERVFVRLGEKGIETIGNEPFHRGKECLRNFKSKIEELRVENYTAYGTEALRRASNGQQFVEQVQRETGIEIQIISGEEEARFIHLGVMQAIPPYSGNGLVMDIGGGSVEFILASQEKISYAQSFPIGVQVLFSNFQKNDPISTGDLLALEYHLEEKLQPLFTSLHGIETPLLIGASGSFEVVDSMLTVNKSHPLYSIINVEDFNSLYYKVQKTNLAQRLTMRNLQPERAELIVVAFMLINFIIRKAGIRQIITSAYSMKEGIMREMIINNGHSQ